MESAENMIRPVPLLSIVPSSSICFVLDRISPTADPTGDHAMQQLVSEGIVPKPFRIAGNYGFDRDDLITSLKAWVGLL